MNLKRWYLTRLLERCFAPHEENIVWVMIIQMARKHFFQDYRLIIWIAFCAVLPLCIPHQWLHFIVPTAFASSIASQMLFFSSAFTLKRQLMKEGKAAELLSLPLGDEEWYQALLRFFYMGFTAIQLPLVITGFLFFVRVLIPANYTLSHFAATPLPFVALAYDLLAAGFFVVLTIFPIVFAGYWVLLGWNREVVGLWIVAIGILTVLLFVFGVWILALLSIVAPIPMVMLGWAGHDCCRKGFSSYLRYAVFERAR